MQAATGEEAASRQQAQQELATAQAKVAQMATILMVNLTQT